MRPVEEGTISYTITLSIEPFVSVIQAVNLPPFEEGQPGQVVFDIRNFGQAPAHKVSVRLAGQLARQIKFYLETIPPDNRIEVVAEQITPLGETLRIDLHYDDGQGTPLHTESSFTLQVKPLDADILVGEDAGSVILRLAEGAPMPKVRIKGAAALVKVEVEK